MRDAGAVLPQERQGPERGFDVAALLAPEQAIIAYFSRAQLTAPRREDVALDDALGRVLASDLDAADDLPSHARSTMDGFAVRAGDAAKLRVTGEVRMGAPAPHALREGEAMRVPTGGALPAGADAVVPLEDVDESGDTIAVRAPVRAGENVTQRGADLRAGQRALAAGRRIGSPELGLLATLGVAVVPVFRKPVFAIVSTGDELVAPDSVPQLGQVRDSNRYAIAGGLRAMGADAVHLPHVADDASAQRTVFAAALERFDGLVLTGGSSVGERDFTPRVVRELGAPGPIVHGLRVKPGKPTLLAAIGGKPVIGLPGNPTSSLMILEAVVRPIVAACTGERNSRTVVVSATATEAFRGREGWTWFVPAQLLARGPELFAQPLPLRSSHVSLLARASGYATLSETMPAVELGARLDIALFSAGGSPIECMP
ncbi:MAG: molybdopterin molybdotransferase MoeA [Candidatus Eremiobacteraeota bacterium]|nr:molybdopterin molybdotransferase MoeA [Candidatus Eremiobacteraeota bacterium]